MNKFNYNGIGTPLIEINGKKHPVRFYHDMNYVSDARFSKERIKGITDAKITLSDEKIICASAYCSVKDTFCRRKGRIVSVGKLYAKLFNTGLITG